METVTRGLGDGNRSALRDHLSAHRLTIVSSITGPQRFSIELPCKTIPVQMQPRSTGLGESLFAFEIDNNYVVGSMVSPIGIVQRNEIEIATIEPVQIQLPSD